MKLNELKKGEIYRYLYNNGRTLVIGKCLFDGTYNADSIFSIKGLEYEDFDSFLANGSFGNSTNYELANNFEKFWLLECLKYNRLIIYKDIIKIYNPIQIYNPYII